MSCAEVSALILLAPDDDFNAFHLLAKSMASLVVRVTVDGMADEVKISQLVVPASN